MLESLFHKVAGLKVCNFIKKRLQHRYFPCEYCKIFKNSLFYRLLLLYNYSTLSCFCITIIHLVEKFIADNKVFKVNRKRPESIWGQMYVRVDMRRFNIEVKYIWLVGNFFIRLVENNVTSLLMLISTNQMNAVLYVMALTILTVKNCCALLLCSIRNGYLLLVTFFVCLHNYVLLSHTFHYHILKSTDVWKRLFIKQTVKMNGCSFRKFYGKLWVGFYVNTEKCFFLEVSF